MAKNNKSFRGALVEGRQVVNVIELDDKTDFTPSEDTRLVRLKDDDRVGPGWTFENGRFVEPVPISPESETTPAVDKTALAKAIDDCKNLERLKDLLIRDILPLL